MSTFCVTIIIISGARGADSRWLIYLTNWSFLLLTMTLAGLTLISILHISQKKHVVGQSQVIFYEMNNMQMTNTELPEQVDQVGLVTSPLLCYEKVVWFLWVISANAGLLVTVEYWLLVFRPPTSFMDISVHALNSVFILTELFSGKLPVRILQWIYVLVFSIIYAVFTIIYWAAGGMNTRGDPYIYDILDYENGKPGNITAVLLVSVIVLSPLIQVIMFVFYRIRLLLDKKKNNNNFTCTNE